MIKLKSLLIEQEQERQKVLAEKDTQIEDERLLRKRTEDNLQHQMNRAAQMEAVLKSHGINIDLDGDGIVGLKEGQTKDTLSASEQAEVNRLMQESREAVGWDANGSPVEEKPKGDVSGAFKLARMMNPVDEIDEGSNGIKEEDFPKVVTHDEELQKKIDETKKSFKEWDEYANEASDENGVIASGTTTEEFNEEVAEVDSVYDNPAYDEPVTPDYGSKPVISDTNQPDIIEEELAKVEDAPKVRMVEEDDIAEFDTPPPSEEETVEVTIPTESELKGMTKSKIQAEALTLGFTGVTTKDSKSKMIDNFVTATEKFISDLQDSGEFVSLQEDGEEDENPSDDRDGGYFK